MSELTSLILVFSIPFLIGLCQVLIPQKCVDLAIKFYSSLGMRINPNQTMWSKNTMRFIGIVYLVFIGLMFAVIMKSFKSQA